MGLPRTPASASPRWRARAIACRTSRRKLLDRVCETPATTVEGVAFKLRAIQDRMDDDTPRAIMNGALNDAERLAGLTLSPPYSMWLNGHGPTGEEA